MRGFTLSSGRVVSVAELHQRQTYAGVLAGRPGPRLNQAVIDAILEEAKWYGVAREARFIRPSADAFAGRLPSVACIAVLESGQLARQGSEPYSSMTVVWFQDELAPPFEKNLETYLRSIDWETSAQEWCP